MIDRVSGNVLRITKVLNEENRKIINKVPNLMKRSSTDNSVVGILVGEKTTHFTTNDGKLFTIDNKTGRTKSSYKIDRNKISRPFVYNNSLLIVKNDAIVKFD